MDSPGRAAGSTCVCDAVPNPARTMTTLSIEMSAVRAVHGHLLARARHDRCQLSRCRLLDPIPEEGSVQSGKNQPAMRNIQQR